MLDSEIDGQNAGNGGEAGWSGIKEKEELSFKHSPYIQKI